VLDKRTGKLLWSKLLESHERNQYASTLLVQTSGLKQYVVYLTSGLASFAEDDGRLLWQYHRRYNFANSYTPLIIEGGLLSPNGYNTGIARLKLTRQDKTVGAEEQYFRSTPLDPFEDSCMLVDGRLYAFKAGGVVACIDAGDGKDLWTARGSGSGKVAGTYADGRLYLRWVNGTVALVEASPKAYVEAGRFPLPEARNSVGCTLPVVTGGRLYLRDNDRLYCYDVRQHPAGAPPPKPTVVQWTPPKYADPEPRKPGQRAADAIFVPTPQDVVAKMLAAAHIGKDDVVYDLGSGDGRILIAAAKEYQCKAIGVEIDRDLVTLSRKRVEEAKLDKLVAIREADIFAADFNDATVVTVYLFPRLLKRLMPKFEQLKPGTRIVSHQFPIPDVPPDKTLIVESAETGAKHTVYLWTTPLKKVAEQVKPIAEMEKPGDEGPAALKPFSTVNGKFVARGQRSSWSPDGKKIVFGRSGNDDGILTYDVATHKITEFTAAGKDPAWSGKDGRWIAYVVGAGATETTWAAEVPQGKPFRIAAGCLPSCAADGKTLFFQAFDQNQLMATEITGSGQFSPPRLRSAVPYRYPAVSPDGKRVAYMSGGDLIIQQMDDGKIAKRFILPQGNGLLGGWSPDSREFGFGGWNAADPMPCIILDVETGLARQVASRSLTFPAWSPDGTKATFDLRLSTGTEIWMIDVEAIKKLPTFKMAVR
jgi:SAM-dependent methyltransferase